jgi:hypothetical protein
LKQCGGNHSRLHGKKATTGNQVLAKRLASNRTEKDEFFSLPQQVFGAQA